MKKTKEELKSMAKEVNNDIKKEIVKMISSIGGFDSDNNENRINKECPGIINEILSVIHKY